MISCLSKRFCSHVLLNSVRKNNLTNATRMTYMHHSSIVNAIRKKMSATLSPSKDHIVWVDLEMSGLNVDKEQILEIACLITDKDLNVIAEAPDLIINQPDSVLNNMDEWCTRQHGASGLTKAVRESKVTLGDARAIMLDFLKTHVGKRECPLAGNSIHVDKLFLERYMPEFVEHLHYRIIDVSTIKELHRRWYPNELSLKKNNSHRALDDIKESIRELQFYRENIFVKR